MDNLDPLVNDIEIIDDEIAFGTKADIADTVIEVPAEAIDITDTNTVLDVAAPIAVGTVAPLAAAIVREEVRTEVVEDTIPAPIAVVEEPVYTAPIVEPVHRPRWPWALLALPLLAIPFLARGEEAPVANPVVVQAPVVREVTPVPEVVEEVLQEEAAPVVVAPKVEAAKPIPTCDGDFIAKTETVLLETASDTAKEVAPIAANAVVFIDAVENNYYEVTVGESHGYLPESVVVCQVALAPATVTG